MKIKSTDFGITTHKLIESRDFYTQHLGFRVVWEGDWYIHLKNGDVEIGLVQPNHPTQPPVFQSEFQGEGAWISFEVEDVDSEYQRFVSAGLPIAATIRDAPWGVRCFALRDPNGIGINLESQIAVAAEYQSGMAETALS